MVVLLAGAPEEILKQQGFVLGLTPLGGRKIWRFNRPALLPQTLRPHSVLSVTYFLFERTIDGWVA